MGRVKRRSFKIDMKRSNKKKQRKKGLAAQLNGEITVFLSLIMTCICMLMGALLESARVAADGWYLRTALYSSMDSLMSQYHREVWEKYHLFLLEYEDEKGLEQELLGFLRRYFEEQSFYCLKEEKPEITETVKITDGGGIHFEQEILDYMKWGEIKELFFKDPAKLEKGVLEAESIGAVTELYHDNTHEVLKLERAVEAIDESMKKQKELLEKGQEELKDCDGTGFIKTAEKFKKECKRMPKLVKTYEKRAAELSEALDQSEEEARQQKTRITDGNWKLLSLEWEHYRSYSEKEGKRYQEILAVEAQAEKNLEIADRAIEEAEKTQEYIDAWESDDEDDELDEEALWEAVLRVWNQIKVKILSEGSGVKDKKTMASLEKFSRMLGKDLLSLVIPEGVRVSKAKVDRKKFPSVTVGNLEEVPGTEKRNLLERVLLNEYLGGHFANFLTERTDKEKGHFLYEQEYILAGNPSDYENLRETVNRLTAVRSAANLLQLLNDPEKRSEAQELAAAITGAAPLLLPVTVSFILMVWAFGEAVMDVRTLFNGGKIPIVKGSGDWNLSLSELLCAALGKGTLQEKDSGQENGMDYQDYLKAMAFVSPDRIKDYRMMDMIQNRISWEQNDFLMTRGLVKLRAECRAKGRLIPVKRKAVRSYENFE